MSRPARIEFEGAFYHVTSRGNEKRKVFLDDGDKNTFIAILKDYRDKLKAVYHSFVLMDNHYHLLLETPLANLTSIMHGINSRYTGYFNRKHKRIGHLFQGRYKALVVDKEPYLLELSRYVHLNPVRAGICEKPEQYHYSSYPGYIDFKNQLDWVEYSWVLGQFHQNKKRAALKYRSFVEERIASSVKFPSKDITAGVILGSKAFAEEMKGKIRKILTEEILERKELRGFIPSQLIMEKVAQYYKVAEQKLKESGKANLPRKAALCILQRKSGLSNKEIAGLFSGIHYTTVSQTVRRTKDNKEILRAVQEIEEQLC